MAISTPPIAGGCGLYIADCDLRTLSDDEKPLVFKLLSAARFEHVDLRLLRVVELPFGMGGLMFEGAADRRLGEILADFSFRDADGVDVVATLCADQAGELFEVSIWKSDFSHLLRWPSADVLQGGECVRRSLMDERRLPPAT